MDVEALEQGGLSGPSGFGSGPSGFGSGLGAHLGGFPSGPGRVPPSGLSALSAGPSAASGLGGGFRPVSDDTALTQ